VRLHRLELSAFGPYPGREQVDFDALGADGVFLLHGDTGAGKTTLLDAVAFALFGRVPGARGEVRRLRCDLADPDTPTEVVLELTVQGHRLRITRSPEYQRPRRRREGFTTQQARASLVWLGDPPSGQPAEGLTRIDEVGRTVQRLLGMSADQFFQVVLLPQGEFARFLRAETAEREQLLERLFGTQRFAQVERWFRERRLESRHDLDRRRQVVANLLARVAQVGGVEPPEDAVSPTGSGRAWLTELCRRTAEDAERAVAEQHVTRVELERAETELAGRRDLAEKVRRVRRAHADLADLDRRAGERATWAAECEAARRAVPVLSAQRAVDRAEQAVRVAVDTVQAAAARAAELVRVDPAAEVAELRATAGEHRERAGALAELVAEVDRQHTEERRLVELEGVVLEAERQATVAAKEAAELPARLEHLRAELDTARQAAARLDGLAARRDELVAAVRDAETLPAVRADLERARRAAQQAVDTHQAARERLLQLRQRRLEGMAAELAGRLAPGDPCPVCGSAEHPAPARPHGDPVTEADERAAQDAEQRAQQARQDAERALAEVERALSVLEERLAGRDRDELVAELAVVEAEHRETVARAGRAAELAAEVAAVEAEAEQLRDRRLEAEQRAAAARAEHAALAEEVRRRAERLERARGGHADVRSHRDHLLTVAAALDELAEARSRLAGAQDHLAEQRRAVEEAARAAGFPGVDAALRAVRDEDTVAELERRLAEAAEQEAAARAVLAEPELCGVDPDLEVDLATAERAVAEARTRNEQAVARAGQAERCRDELAELAERLHRAWDELAPVETAHAELDALTDVINGQGQNARRVSLRSYVLAARLEEVAAAASERLRRMSQGRYSFVHTDARGRYGVRGGLGLDVLDDYSGQVRPAKTLSGGESFLASLALALGLADVVAAESGGVLLDTLFVDEGFGSLDPDTLDVVMDTLDELRSGGRMVGLVSHVEGLRQRIPTQLHVRKTRTGSTLELVT